MRVRLRTLMAGPGGVTSPGQVLDVDVDQARALVAGGYAELVDPTETATLETPEAAVTRRGRARGRE